MRSYLLPLLALAIIVPSAFVQGRLSGRWTTPEAFEPRLTALRRIPMTIGEWEGRDVETEAKTWERAGVQGGLIRNYTAPDGTSVTMLIVCGRPGPTSVHTPEVCYAGAGYEPSTGRITVSAPRTEGPADGFWSTDFLKQGTATPEYLRIFHAWSTDGRWHASANPRLDFAGARALYKLYLIRPMSRIAEPPQDDSALRLTALLTPEIAAALEVGS